MAVATEACLKVQGAIIMTHGPYLKVANITPKEVSVLFEAGTVDVIRLLLRHRDYEPIRDGFIAKYGQPTSRTTTILRNNLGAAFDSEQLAWQRHDGWITLDERQEFVDQGIANISSMGFVNRVKRELRDRPGKVRKGL